MPPFIEAGTSAYIDSAIRLRVAAAWNRFDEATVDSGTMIVPAFDADIVKLFLDPAATKRYVEPVALGGPSNEQERQNMLGLFAKITAEFMFLSKQAQNAGETYTPLWHATPILTPGHAEDLATMIEQVEKKLKRAERELRDATIQQQDIEQARDRLMEADKKCQRAQDDNSLNEALAAVELVGKSMPQAMQRFLGGPTMEGLRFVRVIEQGLIAPLASRPEADAEILYPDESATAPWTARILEKKQRRPGEPSRALRHRAQRDAATIVQIERLNQQAANAGEAIKYVLVTGDLSLHELYDESYWTNSRNKPDSHYLRHPLQYVPFLNFRAMPNDYHKMGLFNELEKSLDNLLWEGARHSPGYPWSLAYERRNQGRRTPPMGAGLDQRLKSLGNLWWKSIGIANAFNFRLAIQDDVRRMSTMFHFLTLPRVSEALVKSQEDLLTQIGGAHLAIGINETLLACITDARRRRQDSSHFDVSRVPLPLLSDFGRFIGEVPLSEFLESLTEELGSRTPYLDRLTSQLQKYPGPTALLLSAAVAAAATRWGAAEIFVNRLQQLGDGSSGATQEKRDAAYLKALILRFDMEGERDYQDALKILDSLEQTRAEKDLELLRTISERAALRLAFFIWGRLREGAKIKKSMLSLLLRAGKDLSAARSLYSQIRNSRTSADVLVQATLERQIYNNSLEHYIYCRLEDIVPKVGPPEVEDMVTTLRGQDIDKAPWLVKLVLSTASALIASDPLTAEKHRDAAAAAMEKIRASHESIPLLDRRLAEYFASKLPATDWRF